MERDKAVRDECLKAEREERGKMSSVSSIFGCGVVMAPMRIGGRSDGGLTIVCSSRPQKKATAHHMKTRPRKTQAWDRNRKPTVYDPLPPLPPDWTLVIPADAPVTPPPPPTPSA